MHERPREAGYKEDGVNLLLGANYNARAGYINVDIEPLPGIDVICDLEKPWPWADESVDHILAEDIFEHLHDPFHSMNEAWRVLKPGGVLNLRLPSTDGRGAFQDPTHVSFWNANSMYYYSIDHPDYHQLYPSKVKCAYRIALDHEPPNLIKVIWFRAICQKVPYAQQVVRDGVRSDPRVDAGGAA